MAKVIRKPAGVSKDMKEYMQGKISVETYLDRVKRESKSIIRSSTELEKKRVTG